MMDPKLPPTGFVQPEDDFLTVAPPPAVHGVIPPPPTHGGVYVGTTAPAVDIPGAVVVTTDQVTISGQDADKEEERVLGRELNVRSSVAPWQMVYGSTRVRGTITFLHTDVETGGEWLHAILTFAAHEVDRVDAIYFDGRQFTHDQNDGVKFYPTKNGWGTGAWAFEGAAVASDAYAFASVLTLGHPDQAANSDAVSQSAILFPGKWTVNHRQAGRAHAYFILYYDPEIWEGGFPDIQIDIRGKKVFDPRASGQDVNDPDTWAWSDNAALIAADYICNAEFGLGADYATEIDEASLIAAANICEESVATVSGTEDRYTINGSFTSEQNHETILRHMARAMAGSISYSGGLWHFSPGKWAAPTITLNEDDCLSDLEITTLKSLRETFNAVQGRYIAPENNYEEADYPIVKNATYAAQDGRQIIESLELPFTNSPARCQRIAKIYLEDVRQGIEVSLFASLRAYALRVGDNVNLSNTHLGWSSKPFRVTSCQLAFIGGGAGAPVLACRLTLKETASGIFDWSAEETTVDLAPNTTIPRAGGAVQKPTGLTVQSGTDHLFLRNDGAVFSAMYVSWTAPTDPLSAAGMTEVQFKKSASSEWRFHALVPPGQTNTRILDVEDRVDYDVRIRTRTNLGSTSLWVTKLFHNVVGKTAAPATVQALTASVGNYGIRLAWSAVPDKDLAFYEVLEDGVLIASPKSTTYTLDTKAAGAYNFDVYAVDSSGNRSSTAASITVTIQGPGTPVPTVQIIGPQVVFNWQAVSTAGGKFAIDEYLIRYGASFEAGTAYATVKGTGHTAQVNWGGVRTFWIAAKDVHGNVGAAARLDVEIISPGKVLSLASDVIDNNVKLSWTASPGTLPIDHYRLYRGNTWAAAQAAGSLGQTSGTILFWFELQPGRYTYWIVAVDSAGNVGQHVGVPTQVLEPPDFVLRADQLITPAFSNLKNLLVGADEDLLSTYDARLIPNLTLWLDATKGVEADSAMRVTAWRDQSGYARDFLQATQAKQPVKSRNDNGENLFSHTSFTDATQWPPTRCSFLSSSVPHPLGAAVFEMREDTTAGNSHHSTPTIPVIAGERYRVAFDVKGKGRHLQIRPRSSINDDQPNIVINTVSGEVLPDPGITATILELGDGWYRATVEFDSDYTTTAGVLQLYMDVQTGPGSYSTTYDGDGSSGIYLARPSLQHIDGNTDFIPTAGARAFRGRNNQPVVIFDGVDDLLTSAATLGDVINDDAFTIFAVATPNGIGQDGTATTPYDDEVVFTDSNGYAGISLRRRSTDNRLTTQDFSNSYWQKTDSVITGGQADPDGGSTAYKFDENDNVSATWMRSGAHSVEKGVTYKFQFKAKAGERNHAGIFFGTGATYAEGTFNLTTGAVTFTGGPWIDSLTLTDEGGGWWLVTLEFTATINTTAARGFAYVRGPSNEFSYDGTDGWGYYIFEPEFFAVTADTMIPAQFYHYDGSMDELEEGLTGPGSYDVLMMKRDASNIYSAINGSTEQSLASGNVPALTGTLAIGARSDAAGHAPIKLAELLIFNRTLTATEIDRVTRYLTIKWAEAPAYLNQDQNFVGMIGPVNVNQTWEEHFGQVLDAVTRRTLSGVLPAPDSSVDLQDRAAMARAFPGYWGAASTEWDTIQEQIDAGFPIYIHPGALEAEWEHEIDYGVDLPASLINFSWLEEFIYGLVTVTPTVSYSLDGETWVDNQGAAQVFATTFRYVRLRLDLLASDPTGLIQIKTLRVRINVKLVEEHGSVEASKDDAAGTPVSFSKNFLDIDGPPIVQYIGNKLRVAVADFEDVPNPTGFTVYVWDIDPNSLTYGQRVDGLVSWSVKGFLNNST